MYVYVYVYDYVYNTTHAFLLSSILLYILKIHPGSISGREGEGLDKKTEQIIPCDPGKCLLLSVVPQSGIVAVSAGSQYFHSPLFSWIRYKR
jgi:hypothetical protein